MYRILLVDDDPHIQTTNEAYLKKQGYQVYRADDGHSALALIQTAGLVASVLVVDMAGLGGVAVCRRLRETSSVPVIFLSAYAKTDDRIRGLMAGGDDYLGKPYSLVELELRLRLRIQGRQNVLSSAVLCFDELEIDLGLREVRYNGERISFPPLEFELLAFLAQNPGQVFSYEQLYDHVWKSPLSRGLHNMQVCMARVRQKLKRICPKRQYIETIRQKGYLFRGEPETN